jgi:hypothetical protein
MELFPILATDWKVWDSLQPCVYHSARHAIVSPAALAQPDPFLAIPCTIKPRNIVVQERATSNGVYQGRTRVWCLPILQNVPQNFRAKPADVIESEGERWIVQTADLRTRNTWWRIESLDLVLAYQLSEIIQIQRATISYDSAGYAVKTFPPDGGTTLYGNLSASVQLITDEVADQRGIRGFLGNYVITVSRQVGVTNEDRVTWTDAGGVPYVFDIVGVHNPSRIDELPMLDCQLRP